MNNVTLLSSTSIEKLNGEQCLEDFVWTRAHERAPKRRPNRSTRGCSFGRKDFTAFCNKASEVLGQPVERMLRGHDHYIEGHRYYEKYKINQMLTLNTRCIQPDMMDGPYSDNLCVAKWDKDEIPRVHILKAPKEQLEITEPTVSEPGPKTEDGIVPAEGAAGPDSQPDPE